MLPSTLQQAIESELAGVRAADLARAVGRLSASYRAPAQAVHVNSDVLRAAYLVARMPATFAAICAALRELRTRRPDFAPARLLDLGSGPGTSVWAVCEFYEDLEQAILLERDDGFIAAGQRLAAHSEHAALRAAAWQRADVRTADLPATALITVGYALNELNATAQTAFVQRAWAACREALVIVEPGTKAGFANVLRARRELIAAGAHIVAPCPHARGCPLAKTDDWCHFAQRLPRTVQHRRSKAAALGHEDEKFAYLIASRAPAQSAPARILRHPVYGKGHVKLSLCTSEGVWQETVTAKNKLLYKAARKAKWGDGWQPAEARA
jgi:ribosomal protein RSM22 (predicted rRNA methylase)